LENLQPIGQWQHKYVLAEGPLGLYLVDQHAAHERVYYERFASQLTHAKRSQVLGPPLTLTLPEAVIDGLEARRGELEGLGFDWSGVGPGTILVRGLPQLLSETGLDGPTVAGLMEGFHTEGSERSWARLSDRAAAMAACKAAIKAYRPLKTEEAASLLEQLAACRDPRSCPHGRPTVLHFTMEEVDRRFGRKG
jgi:DNA mismatch repair protein MutL